MILRYATKRNASGNRKFLAMDTERKVFARESLHWFCKEDLTAELTNTQRRNLIDELEKAGFSEIERL